MGFKLKAALQLAGLSLTTLLLGWVVWHTDYRATPIALTLLLCAQVAVLWRTLTTTNRELTRFLDAISHNDFTQSFKPVAVTVVFVNWVRPSKPSSNVFARRAATRNCKRLI